MNVNKYKVLAGTSVVACLTIMAAAQALSTSVGFWAIMVGMVCTIAAGFYGVYKGTRIEQATITDTSQSVKAMQDALIGLRNTILYYLLGDPGADILSAIAKQKNILNANNRKAIAIFISDRLFWSILEDAFGEKVKGDKLKELYALVTEFEIPVCWLGDLPVYLSQKMTKAPVFVVGEIEWELRP